MTKKSRDLGQELGERIYARFKEHRRRAIADYLARTHSKAENLFNELAARATRRLLEIGVERVLEMPNEEFAGILREVGDEVLPQKPSTQGRVAKQDRLRVIRRGRSG
jgi:plasmid stabilization system protein ParE